MKRLLPLILLATPAYAGPYLELGISYADGKSCLMATENQSTQVNGMWVQTEELSCAPNPLGSIAIGYSYRGFSAEFEHYSSLRNGKDYGLNLLSIKYRIGK